MTTAAPEKPFPYVKFRVMKTIREHKAKGETYTESVIPEYWFLNVKGVHNNTQKITDYIRNKHLVVGYGNLDKPKFADVRNFVDGQLHTKIDPRLLEDEPVKALADKVAAQKAERK